MVPQPRVVAGEVDPHRAGQVGETVAVGVLVQAGEDTPNGGQPDLVAAHEGAQLVVTGAPECLHQRLGVGLGEEPGRLVGGGVVQDVEGYLCHSVTITAAGLSRG